MVGGCTALPICDLGVVRAGWPMPQPSFFMPRKEIHYPMCGRLGGPRHPKKYWVKNTDYEDFIV